MSMDMHWVRHVSYRFRYEFCVAFSTSSGYLDCEDLRVVSVVDRKEVQIVVRRSVPFLEFFKDI